MHTARRIRRTTLCLAAIVALSACSDSDPKSAPDTPSATTTPPSTAPEKRSSQAQLIADVEPDLPDNMFHCNYSGDIPTYSKRTKDIGGETSSLDGTWERFKQAGATDSYVNVYTTSNASCRARVGDTGISHMHGDRKTFMAVIIEFSNPTTAAEAYKADIFGQSQLSKLKGGAVGDATGLGPNSVTGVDYSDVAAHQAVWQDGSYLVYLKSENFSDQEFTRTGSGVTARLPEVAPA